jgi:Ca2+-binding RTX toxin-like protein
MAFTITGTAGNDTLNQSGSAGPGTIAGLAGSDCIFAGSGLATVTGDSGSDTVILWTGNVGTVDGGSENDSIHSGVSIGSMQLFGGDGADDIRVISTADLTIVGGADSNDGPDFIRSGSGNDHIFSNGGDDQIYDDGGSNTIVMGFGRDSLYVLGSSNFVFGNQGNDQIKMPGIGPNTVYAGSGDDLLDAATTGLFHGNEGADTIIAFESGSTIVGGNDSADGNDSITANALSTIFGNGGADTISGDQGANTVIGGYDGDSIISGSGADLVFANEGNDTVDFGAGNNTVFGGQGDDFLANVFYLPYTGNNTIQGNEGDDTIVNHFSNVDTISGGSGNDVFMYESPIEDGDNAAAGGPVELVTDVDFSVDRFHTSATRPITFAANVGAGTGTNLATAATNAIAAAHTLAGGGAVNVAAQFTLSGRTYLAMNQDNVYTTFTDTNDLLIEITGFTGTIATSNFI